jgi:succinate dehydrogenase hydrophobic anchor subunit
VANRLTGLGLVGYLYLHLVILSTLLRGPEAWDGLVELSAARCSWPSTCCWSPAWPSTASTACGSLRSGRACWSTGAGRCWWPRPSWSEWSRWSRRRPRPTFARVAQVTSGVLLLVLLTVHMVAQHFVVSGGLRTYADVVAWIRNPVVFAVEAVLLVCVTWHGIAGVHAVLLDSACAAAPNRSWPGSCSTWPWPPSCTASGFCR